VSLGINAIDRTSSGSHISGIYGADLWLDDSLLLSFRLESLRPADTRYINACIDYTKFMRSGIYVQHLSVLPGNKAPIFHPLGRDGIIRLADTRPHRVRIKVTDASGNESVLEMTLQYTGDPITMETDKLRHDTAHTYVVLPGRETTVWGQHGRAHFDSAALYDAVDMRWEEEPAIGRGSISPVVSVHDATVPVHDAYTMEIRSNSHLTGLMRRRTVMQLVSGDSQVIVKGNWHEDWMIADFNRLGSVRLLVDTIAPVIRSEGWEDGQALGEASSGITVSVSDNLGSVASFEGLLDGAWVPFSEKGNRYTYAFDEHCKRGKHVLMLMARDVAGNETKQEMRFELR
jgi:hypothetical protein